MVSLPNKLINKMNDFEYAYPFASVIEEASAHEKNEEQP